MDTCFNVIDWTPCPQEFFRFCYVSFLYLAMEEVIKNVDVLLCLRLTSTWIVWALTQQLCKVYSYSFFFVRVEKSTISRCSMESGCHLLEDQTFSSVLNIFIFQLYSECSHPLLIQWDLLSLWAVWLSHQTCWKYHWIFISFWSFQCSSGLRSCRHFEIGEINDNYFRLLEHGAYYNISVQLIPTLLQRIMHRPL